jgi:hypothetical protein
MRYDVLPRRPAVKWVASMTDGERVSSENTSGNTSEGSLNLDVVGDDPMPRRGWSAQRLPRLSP